MSERTVRFSLSMMGTHAKFVIIEDGEEEVYDLSEDELVATLRARDSTHEHPLFMELLNQYDDALLARRHGDLAAHKAVVGLRKLLGIKENFERRRKTKS